MEGKMKKHNEYYTAIIFMVIMFALSSYNAGAAVGPALKAAGKVISKNGAKQAANIGGKALTRMSPQLAKQVASKFGKSGAKVLIKAPVADTVRLVEYANKATNSGVRKALLKYYKKGGTKFLDQLSWEKILAGGLSTAMIISAYQVSDGMQEGMANISKESPEVFGDMVARITNWVTMPFVLGAGILLGGLALIRVRFYYKNKKREWDRKSLFSKTR